MTTPTRRTGQYLSNTRPSHIAPRTVDLLRMADGEITDWRYPEPTPTDWRSIGRIDPDHPGNSIRHMSLTAQQLEHAQSHCLTGSDQSFALEHAIADYWDEVVHLNELGLAVR